MLFKENRFVFKHEVSNEPLEEISSSTLENLVEQRGMLKLQIRAETVKNLASIEGVKIDNFCDLDPNSKEKFESQKEFILPKVREKLVSLDLEDLVDKIDEDEDDTKEAIAHLYTNTLALYLDQKFEERFPKYKEYIDAKGAPISQYELSIGKFFSRDLKFGPESSIQAYDKFVTELEAKKKAEEELKKPKPAEEAKPAETEKTSENAIKEKATVLETTAIGGVLKSLGIFKTEDFEGIAKGQNLLGMVVFWVCGYGSLLPESMKIFTDLYQKAKEKMPEQFKPMVQKIENQVKTMANIFMPNESISVEADHFKEMLNGRRGLPEPEKDFKLGDDYQLEGGRKLKITVPQDAKIIIPENTTLQIEDAGELKTIQTQPGETKDLSMGEYIVVGKVPKDVVFNGSMKFQLVNGNKVSDKPDVAAPTESGETSGIAETGSEKLPTETVETE